MNNCVDLVMLKAAEWRAKLKEDTQDTIIGGSSGATGVLAPRWSGASSAVASKL
jgi:cysteine synthase